MRPHTRRFLLPAAGAVALLTVAVACTSPSPGAGPIGEPSSPSFSIQSVPTTASPSIPASPPSTVVPVVCRSGNPLANVYHPQRLHIRSNCRTVTGLVTSVRTEPDGDFHITSVSTPSTRG